MSSAGVDLWVAIPHFLECPEDNLEARMKEQRAPYDVWAREGFLLTTEGNVVDYDAVKAQILADSERYEIAEIAFDPWNATQFVNDLQKAGVPPERLVTFKQTMEHFAAPTQQLLEVLIPSRKLAHLANPVLAWMANNLVVWQDGNGNRQPHQEAGKAKINGMVALIMALGRAGATSGDDSPIHSIAAARESS